MRTPDEITTLGGRSLALLRGRQKPLDNQRRNYASIEHMSPLRITPDEVLHGIIDGPLAPNEQRVDEYMIRVTDAGPDGKGVGEPDASDPPVSRTVHVRAEAGWLIDELIPLLPPDVPFVSRVDETTCAVGSAEFMNLTPAEAYQRVENMLGNLTALMHVYSPNTRRRLEVWQVHELHASGRQSAIKRFTMTVSHADGIAKLTESTDSTLNRAALLLRLAQSDGRISEALALLQAPEPGWGAVYDVLKFVENSPVTKGKRGKVDKYRGTASWYRHLGEPGRGPKPRNAPNLIEARTFAFGLLHAWLELRISKFLTGQSP